MENKRLNIEQFKSFVKNNLTCLLDPYRKKKRKWNTNNSQKLAKARFEKTARGRELRRKVSKRRRQRMKDASKNLSYDEKLAIKEFYRNRPYGMHVDHIIPLAKGGKHCLSNLQYLSSKINFEKAWRLDYM